MKGFSTGGVVKGLNLLGSSPADRQRASEVLSYFSLYRMINVMLEDCLGQKQ